MDIEQRLVERVVAGDRAAFRELVSAYQRLVQRMVYGIVRNPADADEVCQDVFLRVYRGLKNYRGESKLSTWIARIAVHTALKHAAKRRLPEASAAEMLHFEQTATAGDLPFDVTARGELKVAVRRAVAALPAEYRAAVVLYYLEGMSVSEVADVMQTPQGTVKSHLFRARSALKDQLGTLQGDEHED